MKHRCLDRHRFLAIAGALAIAIAVRVAGHDLAAAATRPCAGEGSGCETRGQRPTRHREHRTASRTSRASGPTRRYTPLERPEQRDEGVLHARGSSEVANKQAAERETEQTTPGTTADVHYDFTQFGLDRSQSTFARNLRTSLIVDPPNGKLPPVTAEGQKRAADRAAARRAQGGQYDAVQNMPIGSRCIIMAGAGPPMMNAGYNSNYQIVQGAGYVMILTEMIHDVRVIPVDGRPQPPAACRQWMGISRGRWDGNTLVVETTNFNGKNAFRGASENMKVIERFTRAADDSDHLQFTVEDDSTWARPWTAEMPMKKTEGPIFEFACHESNYGIANILAGARADEKKAAAEAATGCEVRRSANANEARRCDCRRRIAAGCRVGMGTSRVFGGIRREQAAQAEGNADEVGDGQPPLVVPHRRQRPGRQSQVEWLIEGGSPNQLIRMGVTKNTVPPGTELAIDAYQAKDGTNKAVGRNFVLADGTRLFLGGSAPGGGGDTKTQP